MGGGLWERLPTLSITTGAIQDWEGGREEVGSAGAKDGYSRQGEAPRANMQWRHIGCGAKDRGAGATVAGTVNVRGMEATCQ